MRWLVWSIILYWLNVADAFHFGCLVWPSYCHNGLPMRTKKDAPIRKTGLPKEEVKPTDLPKEEVKPERRMEKTVPPVIITTETDDASDNISTKCKSSE